jgi:hypothetical protein
MRTTNLLMAAALVGVVFAAPACTQKAMNETKTDADKAVDELIVQ